MKQIAPKALMALTASKVKGQKKLKIENQLGKK